MTAADEGATRETSKSGSENNRGQEIRGGRARRVQETAMEARTRASEAYRLARERAGSASRRTAEGIEHNPVSALVGGFALGAIMAAILPRTRREEDMLGDYGRRINERARDAARAARDAATSKFDEFGLSRDAARQKLSDITAQASDALRTTAGAAAEAMRRR